MNTFQLTCFLTVAETLSFSKAAKQLNVTQPAVTHQIRTLEEELHTKLFRRASKKVGLTQEGSIFLTDAKNILNIADTAKKRFEDTAVSERQVLSIGSHSYPELHLLAGILGEMQAAYPSLCPEFHVVPYEHLYQLLEEETIDVVVSFRERKQEKLTHTYKELARTAVAGMVPREHPLARKDRLSADDLAHEKLILLDPQKSPELLLVPQYELSQKRSVSDVLLYDTLDACLICAKAGLGVTILPALEVLRDPALACIPLEGIEPMSYGAYYKSVAGKPLLKLFLRLSQEHFPGGGFSSL